MSLESEKKMWAALMDVHRWLTVDFIYKVNHASAITDEDWKPFFDANQTLKDKQFDMAGEVFRMSRHALVESLYSKLGGFIATTNLQIQARDVKDWPLQKQLLAQMGEEYNTLVSAYENDLHEIKAIVDAALQAEPRINLPSLQYVGGGIIISSPHAVQDNSTLKAALGSTVNVAPVMQDDHSTHITSNITNSPGAIANVAQHLANVTNRISGEVEGSSAGEDVKALMKQLIEQIASLNAAVNPDRIQQMADDLTTLGQEIAKPQPQRKWYDLSLQGIKEAAEAVGDVGKPIVTTVMKLMPLLMGV